MNLVEPSEAEDKAALLREVVDILRSQREPLFALLDAARSPRVLALLRESGAQYQSLYEGKKGNELAEFAPYLVEIPADSDLLGELVSQSWGNAWGIYLTSQSPFSEVRRHFRHFLLVRTEDKKELYFRFYDPRVLRAFLSTCTMGEVRTFFGCVRSFFVEDESQCSCLQYEIREDGQLMTVSTSLPKF